MYPVLLSIEISASVVLYRLNVNYIRQPHQNKGGNGRQSGNLTLCNTALSIKLIVSICICR